jgi:hypothetical protein
VDSNLTKVEQIQKQIRELSASEFAQLRDWMFKKDWQRWDEQIEAAARAGKLDEVVAEAQAAFLSGEPPDHLARARRGHDAMLLRQWDPIGVGDIRRHKMSTTNT